MAEPTLLPGTNGGDNSGYGKNPKSSSSEIGTTDYDPYAKVNQPKSQSQPTSDYRNMGKFSGDMTPAEVEAQMRQDILPGQASYQSAQLGRGAAQAGGRAVLYGNQAQESYGQQLGSRGYTNEQLARMEARARGEGPSVTGMQLAQALAANRAQASSMAAGARGGPGAQAAALRGAMYANAAAGQNTAGQAAMSALQERLGYENALTQAANAQRQADLAARGQGVSAEAGMAGLSAEQYKAMLAAQMQYEQDKQKGALGMLNVGLARHGQDVQQDIARQEAEAKEDAAKWGFAGTLAGGLLQYKAATAGQPPTG